MTPELRRQDLRGECRLSGFALTGDYRAHTTASERGLRGWFQRSGTCRAHATTLELRIPVNVSIAGTFRWKQT